MSLINLTTKQLIKQFPKKVQPQTILNPIDKFPINNKNFVSGLQEWVAVILGIKPICITKVPSYFERNGDHLYNLNQIHNLLNIYSPNFKANKIFCMLPYVYNEDDKWGGTVMLFEKKNMKKAMLLFYMRKRDPILFPNKKSDDWDIINGKLLRYSKNDIFAWYLLGELYKHLKLDQSFDFDIESVRNSIITNPKAIQFKKKYTHKFNKLYNLSINRIPKLIEKSKKMERIEHYFEKNMTVITGENILTDPINYLR